MICEYDFKNTDGDHFGASTEKTPQIDGQWFLFGELIDEILDETENKVINIKEHKRPIFEDLIIDLIAVF